ncbi:MAG TPA: hypothetical protein VHW60_16570 [Caulobacteraceae bacterium]|nr:hypothetical protein [Caulobacteraceae bacterium]
MSSCPEPPDVPPTAAAPEFDKAGSLPVGANLARAIERGFVIHREDGRLSLRRGPAFDDEVKRSGGYIGKRGATRLACDFLNRFMFEQVYARAAVPFGCRNCFKIRIATRSLRALMAAKAIAEATPHATKSGPEADNPHNACLYATWLYFDGLDAARQAYQALRPLLDAHEHLGPDVGMIIKRGCSNYERALGPSDRYEIDPRLEAVEAHFAALYDNVRPRSAMPKEMVHKLRMLDLVALAFRIGDETYKDFAPGPPYPSPVNYTPPAQAPVKPSA